MDGWMDGNDGWGEVSIELFFGPEKGQYYIYIYI
jgi:hypothetical protein